MPTGNLPASGKALWEEVYNKNKKEHGEAKAAQMAWGAVENAGWSKDKDGKWHKKSGAVEFSMHIERASYTDEKGMGWKATASDIHSDKANDEMSLELYQDFIANIDAGTTPPEEYCSDFWAGGLPYVSLSHYPDLNGDAVPGMAEKVWIDGDRFKAKGNFLDTPLGRACFKAVKMDTSGPPHPVGPVRVSIAFLDYGHVHKSNGFTFLRTKENDWCEECVREFMDKSSAGKRYIKGHLIHLAMTRVPMNERTAMEVEKSMTTRKEDALSIVEDEELLEGIEEKSKLVGKSELVIKADEEVEKGKKDMPMHDEEDMPMTDEEKAKKKKEMDAKKSDTVEKCGDMAAVEMTRPFGGATTLAGVKEYMVSRKEDSRISDIWYAFQTVLDNINYSEEMPVEDKAKAIAKAADEFKTMVKDKNTAIYESLVEMSIVEPELVEEAKTKTVGGKSYSASDFLVVEDANKPSTWHLQVKRNGKPDHNLMAAARAALTSNYRGHAYGGPNKSAALSKLKRLYASEKMKWEADVAEDNPVTVEEILSEDAVAAEMSEPSVGDATAPAMPEWANTIFSKLDAVTTEIQSLKSAATVEPHPLDSAFALFKADVDEIRKTDATPEEKLHNMQASFNEFGAKLAEMIRSEVKEESKAATNLDPTTDAIVKAITAAMTPVATGLGNMSQKLDMLMSAKAATPDLRIPQRRSIQQPVNSDKPVVQSKAQYSVSEVVDKTI